MDENKPYEVQAVETIKHKIRLLNWITILITYVLLLLIVRFIYKFLDYIPLKSAITMLAMMTGLLFVGFYIARTMSNNAIRAIEDYAGRLSTLLSTTKDMHEIIHSDMLLKKIMDSSLSITQANAGSILLKEGENLIFKVVRGSGSEKLVGFSIPQSHGIAGWVADSGSSVRIADARHDGRFYAGVDGMTGYETRSVLCAPLRSSSGNVGVLELLSEQKSAFTLEDEQMISYFASQAAVSIERAKFYEDEKNYRIHVTSILSNINDQISEKRGHSKRIARYTLLMASGLNLPEAVKQRLYNAALLHDIGFLYMNLDEITSLNEYRSHSQIGYEMLKPINFYSDIAPIVRHHHERYDGKGYPDGLKGEAIPIESRIIAVAEAFDAMVSRSSYKLAGKMISSDVNPQIVSFKSAMDELKAHSGTQFDAEVVEVFVKNIYEDFTE